MLHRFLLISTLFFTTVALADPMFTVEPQEDLPTVPGSMALYTVTNNTLYTLKNNGILPQKNVTQDIMSPECFCPANFSLTPGESCTLALYITGPTTGGPAVCNTVSEPARCSQPTENNRLNIKHHGVVVSNNPSLGIVQTVDGGASWDTVSLSAPFTAATCSSDVCVAGGPGYSLAQTDESGSNWFVVSLGEDDGIFNHASCEGEWCVLAGGGLSPEIVQQDPETFSWSFVTHAMNWPATGQFDATGCSNDVCMAAGNDNNGYLFIAESTGPEEAWTVPVVGTFLMNVFGGTCQGEWCLVAGNECGGSTLNARLYQRDPRTQDWSDITSTIEGLGPSSETNYFYTAACNDDMCIAVGSVLAQSTDQGKHWAVVASDVLNEGTLYGASCTDAFCVAVGTGDCNDAQILQTTNGGKTWTSTYVSGLPDDAYFASLNGVSCSGNFCVAQGDYTSPETGENPIPFIAQTTDGGKTWAVVSEDFTDEDSLGGTGSQ